MVSAGGALLLASGIVGILFWQLLDPASATRRKWERYIAALDAENRFLFRPALGRRRAQIQALISAGIIVTGIALGSPVLLLALPFILVPPLLILRSQHEKRVLLIQRQLDTWLLMLANSLRAAPSLGEALGTTARLMHPPMSQEIDLCLKEMRLGTPLDQAVLNMGARINSRSVSGALTTVLVGRQTGGDLSRILEESASMLREMSRLEGVVRAKTAEARAQFSVLAFAPLGIVLALGYVDPKWMDPLWETPTGNAVIALAVGLYAAALLLAQKVLKVDV